MTGAEIRQLRIDCGLTKADVAREVGLTRQSVADSERAAKVRYQTMERYLAAFTAIAKRQREDRLRQQTEHLLSLTDVTDISIV